MVVSAAAGAGWIGARRVRRKDKAVTTAGRDETPRGERKEGEEVLVLVEREVDFDFARVGPSRSVLSRSVRGGRAWRRASGGRRGGGAEVCDLLTGGKPWIGVMMGATWEPVGGVGEEKEGSGPPPWRGRGPVAGLGRNMGGPGAIVLFNSVYNKGKDVNMERMRRTRALMSISLRGGKPRGLSAPEGNSAPRVDRP